MSISSEIDRINTNVANTYSALEGAGADMPAQQNTDNLPETVLTIKAVRYDAQTLTDAQKAQARENIGAIDKSKLPIITRVFSAYDRFADSIARMEVNPTVPLDIKTYDGSNKPTHPCALYIPEGWNGHKYWLAYTPFPNNDNAYENPCLAYSDDGVNFSSDGLTNPVENTPMENGVKVGFNSDVHIVLVNGVMECWWRTCQQKGTRPGYEIIYRKKSTDGVNWTEKEELYAVEHAGFAKCLSPVVIYKDGKYLIWYNWLLSKIVYCESEDGTNWQEIRRLDFDQNLYPDYKIWHHDIKYTEGIGYEFVASYRLEANADSNLYVFYAQSDDNIAYTTPTLILTVGKEGNFDATELYRPSIIREPSGVKVYYGCRNGHGNWRIGLIEAPHPFLFNAIMQNQSRFADMQTRLTELEEAESDSGTSTRLTALEGTVTELESKVSSLEETVEELKNAVSTVPCTGITLNTNALTINSAETQYLTATLTPADTTQRVKWSVSPSGIVTVGVDGAVSLVDGVESGECVITATCGNVSATCAVTVFIAPDNILEDVAMTTGYLDPNTGEVTANTSNKLTNFINVTHLRGTELLIYGRNAGTTNNNVTVCCFDENKNYLSGIGSINDTKRCVCVTVPDTATYMRVMTFGATSINIYTSTAVHPSELADKQSGHYFNTTNGTLTAGAAYECYKIPMTADVGFMFASYVESCVLFDTSGAYSSNIYVNTKNTSAFTGFSNLIDGYAGLTIRTANSAKCEVKMPTLCIGRTQ